ncbi:hypothetical protein GCM10009837_61650 [Streptomyces durmitorensis]
MPERGRRQGRPRPGNDSIPLKPVEPGLQGATSDTEHTRVLTDTGAGLLQEETQDAGVEFVDGHGAGAPGYEG